MTKSMFLFGVVAAAALAAAQGAAADQRSDFLTKAVQGDNSEIMLGRLAEQRAATPGVKRYGRTLVEDHSKGKRQALAVADALGVRPPDQPLGQARHEYKKLEGLRGPAFDREFVRYMISDHQKDISDFRKEGERGDRVGALARQTLPVLNKHLDMALSLRRG